MSYKAIYRKYRPSTFDDVAGQRHIVTTLTNAIKQNRLSHAYLFSGPSGNGKTSIAKLFAKSVNCTSDEELICNKCSNCLEANSNSHPDIIEMDAASNNGVDDIRNLIEKVKYAPLKGKYKIYIIDEVHMLSLGAFNALLKTLEEPPAHVIFILATTEPHKVIPTIMSRCQRYDFTKVKNEDIEKNIEKILHAEDINYDKDALTLISTLAEGGVRKSLSILEQVVAFAGKNITVDDVTKIYGLVTKEEKLELLEACSYHDLERALEIVNSVYDKGNNLEIMMTDIIQIAKELIIYNYSYNEDLLEILTLEEAEHFNELFSSNELLAIIDNLTTEVYLNEDVLSFFELSIIKIINSIGKKDKITISHDSIEDYEEVPQEALNKIFEESEKTKARMMKSIEEAPEVVDKINEADIEDPKIDQEINNTEIEEQNYMISKSNDTKEIQSKTHDIQFQDTSVDEEIKNDIKSLDEKDMDQSKNQFVIDDNLILSLLAHADKEKRITMDSDWKQLSLLNEKMDFVRYEKLMSQSSILAAGENYLVIVVSDDTLVNTINDEEIQGGLNDFLKSIFGQPYRVIAISLHKSKVIIEEFKNRISTGKLPDKVEISIPEGEQIDNSIEANAQRVFNGFFETEGD